MNFLFVHTNFPAQFRHVARALAADPRHTVVAIGSHTARQLPNIRTLKYGVGEQDMSSAHPFARRFDIECRRAEQVMYVASSLTATGFQPDVVVVHPGWGEHMPLRALFPRARIVIYCEFFYRAVGLDIGFDPESPSLAKDGIVSLLAKNATTPLALADCDAAVSPTKWQKATFPREFFDKIKVIHDGIDTSFLTPDPRAVFTLPSGRKLTRNDEVITYVARNIEPLHGYHSFMRALPAIMRARQNAQVLIIGGDGVSYGPNPPAGTTWKQLYLDEVADRVDLGRIHYLGAISYENFMTALRVSSAHVYFTYPFVLSWSALEAMSLGCVFIGSDTGPVREIIDGANGVLVPFLDPQKLAAAVVAALANPRAYDSMRANARATVQTRFDLKQKCLPEMIDLIIG